MTAQMLYERALSLETALCTKAQQSPSPLAASAYYNLFIDMGRITEVLGKLALVPLKTIVKMEDAAKERKA
jgi:hypothetical protein